MIKKGIARLTETLLNQSSKKLNEIRHFAIHPGGKKILQVIEEELGIDKEKNEAAYKVLENFGNMSSATVLFVLNELITKLSKSDIDEHILSFAFGPGLTMESMLMQIKKI
jgi:predicted naringenin-chalcone synthase